MHLETGQRLELVDFMRSGPSLVTVRSAFHMFDYICFMHVQYTHSSAGKYFHAHSKPNMWMLLTARLKTFVV